MMQLSAIVLDELVRRIVDAVQPEQIVLFGSAARGEMGPDSDVDLLVVKSGISSRRRVAMDIYRRLAGVGVPVDVVVVTAEDIKRYKDKVGSVISQAVREGRAVYVA